MAYVMNEPCSAAPLPVQHRTTTAERLRELLAEATRFAEADLDEDIDLQTVARRLYTSVRQVQRAFAAAETTWSQARACARMRRAADLLRDRPDLTVGEVAARVGYRQPAQFGRAFQRHHGCAPSQHRRLTPR